MVAGGAGGGYFLGMRYVIQLPDRPSIWATIAVMVVCWLCVDYPYGLTLFLLCAAWPWALKHAHQLVRREVHPDVL